MKIRAPRDEHASSRPDESPRRAVARPSGVTTNHPEWVDDDTMLRHRILVLVFGLTVVLAEPASAQEVSLRLAAPEDCLTNPNCVPGLRRVYDVDARAKFVPLTAADAGV